MKKAYVIILAIIVCILLLGIGFYFGRENQVLTNSNNQSHSDDQLNSDTQSNFDKQNKCASYYNVYKDKLSYLDETKTSSLDSLSVSYSPALDNCIASWIVVMDFESSSMYDFNIVNASRGDQPIYKCYGDPSKEDDKCNIKAWRNKIYELTYSDVIDEIMNN